MSAQRLVQLVSGVVETEAGAPARLLVDGDGNLKVVTSGGGGGGGVVTQGARDASAQPWYVYMVDPSDDTPWLGATEITLSSLVDIALETGLDVQSLDNKFQARVDLSSSPSGTQTTQLFGAALMARDENNNQWLRVAIDTSTRGVKVFCHIRGTNAVTYGSWNGSANTLAWGRQIVVTGSAQIGRVVVTNKSGSDAYLFVRDKGAALATSDLPTLAPRKVAAGATVEVVFNYPLPMPFSSGIVAGLSTTAADYQEIGADDAWFEVHRMQ